MRAPDFWRRDGVWPNLLSPLGALYAWGGARRLARVEAYRPAVPVICVGNVVAGGAGKTPVAIALARALLAARRSPHFLTRGHGGTEVGPRAVDPLRHDAARVGDEPLLLAAEAPTWVARCRPEGAVAAVETGADVIVMDDGFQSGRLAIDLALVVADGGYGFGNGRVIPAGPCREPPARALARADAVVVVGADSAGVGAMARDLGLMVLTARLVPDRDAPDLAGRRVYAFAGIGLPDKFFASLAAMGADVVGMRAFADHHPYRVGEIAEVFDAAKALSALPVTTAKDRVRIPAVWRDRVTVLPVRLEWDQPALLAPLLDRIGVTT